MIDDSKKKLFEDEGYKRTCDKNRSDKHVYINKNVMKEFSDEYIADHSIDRLRNDIQEPNRTGGLKKYYNPEP